MYRVIIADDSREFLDWLAALLSRDAEFEVLGEAASGEEALMLAELLEPDAIIADVDMPGLDGFDLARQARERLSRVQVVLISSHAGRSYERLARDEGAVAFFSKAILTPDLLREALGGVACL